MNRSIRSSAVPGRSLGNRWPAGVVVVGFSDSMGMSVRCVVVGIGVVTVVVVVGLVVAVVVHSSSTVDNPAVHQQYYFSPELRTIRKLNIPSIVKYSPEHIISINKITISVIVYNMKLPAVSVPDFHSERSAIDQGLFQYKHRQ